MQKSSQRILTSVRALRRSFCRSVTALLVMASVGVNLPLLAQSLDTDMTSPVRGQVSISRDVNVASADEKVSLSLRNASLRDVLHALAAQGKFNIILDESIEGTLTVDIKDVSVNKALEYIFTAANLSYSKDGNTIIVATKEKADEKNLTAKTFKAIPVLYRDAAVIAMQLNNTIFKVPRPGGSTTALAAYDPDSNSLLIMGTDADIKLVSNALRELDKPRNRRVYKIKHNHPSYIAQVLAANFFMSAMNTGGMGGMNGGMTGGMMGGTMNGGMAGGNTNGGMGNMSGGLAFMVGGVTFIPEPISSTLTVLATDEQLALIDSIIEQVDVRRPQVEIEVSLVEIQNSELKVFAPMWKSFQFGKESMFTINNLAPDGTRTGTNFFQFSRNNFPSTRHLVEGVTIENSHKTLRAKVLANPTVVAMDGATSKISITDQVPNIVRTQTVPTVGPPVTTTTITTTDAGIEMEITPQIFNDGSVQLKLTPKVTQPTRPVTAEDGVSTTLISTREMDLSAVRIRDGETLVIGGLLKETSNLDIDKVPGLDKLPIVRAMFNATNRNDKERTELVLMVTPHIIKEDAVSYFDKEKTQGRKSINPNQGVVQPISLPKFTDSNSVEQGIMPATQSRQVESGTQVSAQPSGRPDLKPAKKDTVGAPERMERTEAFKLPSKQPLDKTPTIQKRQVNERPGGAKKWISPMPDLKLMDEVLKN